MSASIRWKIALLALAVLTPFAVMMYTGWSLPALLSSVLEGESSADILFTSPNISRNVLVENNQIISGEASIQDINLYRFWIKGKTELTPEVIVFRTLIPENKVNFSRFYLSPSYSPESIHPCTAQSVVQGDSSIIESITCTLLADSSRVFSPDVTYTYDLVGTVATVIHNWMGKIIGIDSERSVITGTMPVVPADISPESGTVNPQSLSVENRTKQRRIRIKLGENALPSMKNVSWTCYSGERHDFTAQETCATQKQWLDYADYVCRDKCTSDNKNCGVDVFVPGVECS